MTTTQVKTLQQPAPTGLGAAAVGSGGTFTAGAKFWVATAIVKGAESPASAEATVTVALNGSANLTWANPAGCQAVKIYRGTATGAENTLVVTLAGNTAAWTDTGAAGSAASPPAASAFANAAKNGVNPAKANVPAGTAAGLAQAAYAGLSGWCAATLLSEATVQTRNRKLMNSAGMDVQEV
jgi:hypothetical protein